MKKLNVYSVYYNDPPKCTKNNEQHKGVDSYGSFMVFAATAEQAARAVKYDGALTVRIKRRRGVCVDMYDDGTGVFMDDPDYASQLDDSVRETIHAYPSGKLLAPDLDYVMCDECGTQIDRNCTWWGGCSRCERTLCEICVGQWTELDPDGQGCCVCAECLVSLAKEGLTSSDLMNAGLHKVESPEQLSLPSAFTPGIKEVVGDLFDHVKPGDVICHIVNNEGVWGRGFVVPLGEKYPMAKEAYLGWCDVGNVALGECLPVACGGGATVVNMCAQNGLARASNPRPLSYSALRCCLTEVAERISPDRRILMPRIGAGLGGGDWSTISEIITETLGDRDVTIFVLPGQN